MTTEPSAGWIEGREHQLPVRIYYEDTDFTGMVYHANYLRYFERGRSDFFRIAGISHTALLSLAEPTAFTLVRIEIDYRRAARVDDALRSTGWRVLRFWEHDDPARAADIVARALSEI